MKNTRNTSWFPGRFPIGNPRLVEPVCQTQDQMRMANAFCACLEGARMIGVDEVGLAQGARS